jgi:hypothetical protein
MSGVDVIPDVLLAGFPGAGRKPAAQAWLSLPPRMDFVEPLGVTGMYSVADQPPLP